jgi:hypothetical protein
MYPRDVLYFASAPLSLISQVKHTIEEMLLLLLKLDQIKKAQ